LSITLCLCLMLGATFALFSSRSTVNIAIDGKGGKIENSTVSISGGLDPTFGKVLGDVVFELSLGTNHNQSNLLEGFEFSFVIVETPDANDDRIYNFKPYNGYVYTEGDEDKIHCLNDGYEVVWNATISQFEVLPVQNP
ncbi:MAG: hypothetical protein IIX01_02875, partial [Clostridia bacterium]|nr:hypothetical protein [Clostridia bacterium]